MALPLRDDTPTRAVPWATYAIIVVNVVVFLLVQPAALQDAGPDGRLDPQEQSEVDRSFLRWGAVPCEIEHLQPLSAGIACEGERSPVPPPTGKVVLLSLLTAMFIHGGVIHLASNMLFLWVFGANVEDRLGPVGFLALYLVTGVLATLGHTLFHVTDAVPVVGASGAIAGIMGAYLLLRPRGRILAFLYWTIVYVPAWMLLGLFFVTQFLTPDSEGVAWEAHAVGMVAGFLLALPLARLFPDPHRRPGPSTAEVPALAWSTPAAPPTAPPGS